jgi:hypothetical protein
VAPTPVHALGGVMGLEGQPVSPPAQILPEPYRSHALQSISAGWRLIRPPLVQVDLVSRLAHLLGFGLWLGVQLLSGIVQMAVATPFALPPYLRSPSSTAYMGCRRRFSSTTRDGSMPSTSGRSAGKRWRRRSKRGSPSDGNSWERLVLPWQVGSEQGGMVPERTQIAPPIGIPPLQKDTGGEHPALRFPARQRSWSLQGRNRNPCGWRTRFSCQHNLDKEEGVFVRTRLVRLLMVGALTFGLLRLVASAATLETLRALPAAQQRPAPAFTLPDLHGMSTRLVDLRGKVVVVRFWVTW